ncbi:acyl-CoA dehydrogenase family protein [Streptomyces sp. E11-3]|uniref:acyl-CoA dehydrogenase family protein n=1 Tax=Streptomyces sp. E11-3 TaxID=3110112 RepID=UPI0039804E94
MPADTELDAALAPAAEKVRLLAAQHAAEADRTGKLAPAVVEAIREAGFARHLVSARWGGVEGSFQELTRSVMTVAESCPATAWCASLSAYSARFAAYLPEAAHEALWGASPDTVVATGLVPSGQAEETADGWRLSGSWNYVSGIDFADWVLLCARLAGGGDGPPRMRFFALPRGTFTIQETWDNVGMRATGSHTVVVDDVRVPGHLSVDRVDIMSGRNATSGLPAHNVPFQAVGSLTFIAPVVGAAMGALKEYAAAAAARRRTPGIEIKLVRASGRIDAARHLVEQNAQTIDERRFTPELMARNERNSTFATEMVQEAITLLIRGAGTGGLSEAQPLQRLWRDITSASSHVALQYDTAARKNYAAALLGPEQ